MSKHLMGPMEDTFREWLNKQLEDAKADHLDAKPKHRAYYEGRYHAFEDALREYELTRGGGDDGRRAD